MNAVGYIRISTKDQSQYSLEYQENNVRRYCQQHGLTLLEVFKDDGESSYTFDRPDWLALEKFIKQNKSVQYLVIFDHDRFSRNLAEALIKIKELQDKFGVKVLATTDNFDTDFSDPSTFMMRAFKLMMAENELWRIRHRTKNGMLQAALNGRFLGKAPWGYINARDENKKPILIIDDERAIVIRMIFKEFNRGTNIENIRKLVSPLGYNQRGNSALQTILSNPIYAGMLKVPAHNGKPEQIQKGIHPAIISESDYWQAQYKLSGKRFTRQTNEEVPLRGIIKCQVCGNPLTAGKSKGRRSYYWYYVCHKDKQNLSATKLHEQFYEILDYLSFEEQRIKWYSDKLGEEIARMISQRGEILAKTQKVLRQTNEQIQATEEKYLLAPEISPAVFKNTIATLRKKQIELQRRLIELDQDQNIYWQKLNETLPKLHDIRQTLEGIDLNRQRQFISLVFNNSLSHDGVCYRTAYLHPMFAHNAMILKEKGLLTIEQPSYISEETPVCAPDRS